MKLMDNAFAVLGAMPADNRVILNEKADEAALLGDGDAEAALTRLMQMNRRIPVELGWFPGATREAASAFLDYARALSEGRHMGVPPLEGLGTPLAQANALSALFEIWPVEDGEMYIALCRALDSILSQVTAEETLRAINADREAGRWETIPDAVTLNEPLNERLRDLCQPVSQAASALSTKAVASALDALNGPTGIDPLGSVAQAVGNAYSMRIHEEAGELRDSILAEAGRLGNGPRVSESEMSAIRGKTDRWCALTAPLRLQPGVFRNEAKNIGHGVRNVLVNYINKATPEKKKKTVYVPVHNGTRVVTFEYNSQSVNVKKAIDVNKWLRVAFPEQLELLERLKDDDIQLNQMLKNEENMVSNAETEAFRRGLVGR